MDSQTNKTRFRAKIQTVDCKSDSIETPPPCRRNKMAANDALVEIRADAGSKCERRRADEIEKDGPWAQIAGNVHFDAVTSRGE